MPPSSTHEASLILCPGNEDWRVCREFGGDQKTLLGGFDGEWLSAPTGVVLDSAAEKSAGSECFTSFIDMRRRIFSRVLSQPHTFRVIGGNPLKSKILPKAMKPITAATPTRGPN